MERFSTPKVLAVRPNLREWWVGEKISRDNDVLRWGCCCRIESAAIQKRMRSCWSLQGRRQVRTQFLSWYSRHLFSRKFPSTKHVWTTWTRISVSFLHVQINQILEWSIRDISLTFSDTTRRLTNRDRAPWVPPFSPLFFCGYWRFSLLGKTHCAWNAMHSARCKVFKTKRNKVELQNKVDT